MIPLPKPTLIVFGGLPGTGKTTIARAISERTGAVYVRIDAIEQAIKDAGVKTVGPAGYSVGNAMAEANLRLGLSVIADCVNPVAESRAAWRATAARASAALVEIELTCSDPAEHRRRIESRLPDIAGHRLPTWDEITRRTFEVWSGVDLIVDTASADQQYLINQLEAYAREQCKAS